MYNIEIIRRGRRITALTSAWQKAVLANGGSTTTTGITILNQFTQQLVNKSYYGKIIYLLPMMGVGIGAATVPLIDTKHAGNASNTNFVNSDFSENTGLQGDGSSKILTVALMPSQFGAGNNGGLGWWENNINFGGSETEVMGFSFEGDAQRFVIDLRSGRKFFCWGDPANAANVNSAATNGHYYGQRTAATNRELYQNGSQITTNSTNDAATGSSDANMQLVGANDDGTLAFWAGRCAVTYFTDGTLSTGEATDLDSLLRTYLVSASGKI